MSAGSCQRDNNYVTNMAHFDVARVNFCFTANLPLITSTGYCRGYFGVSFSRCVRSYTGFSEYFNA